MLTPALRRGYSPVSSEDSESALKSSSMQRTNWLVPRRIRTAILLVLLVILVLVMSDFPTIPHRIHEFAPTRDHSMAWSASPSQEFPATEQLKVESEEVNWSQFAYVQYVTNTFYLCNSLMILETLHRLGTKADRIMMYPRQWVVSAGNASDQTYESKLLVQARDMYDVKLVPIQVKTFPHGKDKTWQDSYTKLLAFNQTQYKRIITLDSDATVLQPMDELFFLPSAPVAMPRAYWEDSFFLSSQIIVIEPSEFEWKRVEYAMDHHQGHDYDMDILNKLYGKSALVLPHRNYDLVSGEFRNKEHVKYLGSNETWDGKKVLEEAKFMHFSDWPMAKPWLRASPAKIAKLQPECKGNDDETKDCTDRDIWLGLYKDFSERRQRICGRDYDDNDRSLRRSRIQRRSEYEPVLP